MEMEADTSLDHFDIEITDTPDIEIQCSDNTPEDSENFGNQVQSSVSGASSAHEADFLRASLSEVVLTQSLQFTEKSIDFEDGSIKNSSAQFVESFDSIVPAKKADPDVFLSFENNDAAPKDETPEVCTDSGIGLTEPDSSEAASATFSPFSSSNEKPQDDIADFEDAMDPPLLTSTLKAEEEDSDDEFGFDLPGSKSDNGKSVRFSGGDDNTRENEATKAEESMKEADKTEVTESRGQTGPSVAAVPVLNVDKIISAQPTTAEAKIEAAPPQPDVINVDEDKSEQQDRSHIITSSAADWDNVETVEAGYGDAAGDGGESMIAAPPLMAFGDFWRNFRSMDHTAVKDKIQVTVEKNGFAAIVSRLFGPPRLHKDLHTEREHVFCVAATAMDNGNTNHVQSLQTIYRVLTGSRFNCQRYGSHWEEVGFQGRDPATDLRGAGMLGLVQMVSFLQDETTAQLARDMYKLSLHPTQNFPFCVMCINISRISLQALREGILNRECNKQQSVMGVVNQFYAGALLHLYRLWKQGKTISDSGFVIRDVETRAKKHTKELLKDLQTYITSQKAGNTTGGAPLPGQGEGDVSFFSVVKSDTKTAAELY